MKQREQLKRYTVTGIFFVLLAGTLSHFLYQWTNNNLVVGLFVPVNESVWEHMKLLFFPMLFYSSVMAYKQKEPFPCVISALCFGMLAGTACIPAFFYAYTLVTGESIFILDLAIFLFSTVIAFLAAYRFTLSCKLQAYTVLFCSLVCILAVCFMIFTYHPPGLAIFSSNALP